eukprot:TRINITY_DN791_c1_g1_i2.p2 TRINITY_DN791_c1_g1~~TRINITY_DN791_c1_g1_i2.p2  ORF type:complete len:104 (-),score=16.15 TRINITY_DN791_c1_g1_i2:45-356(-)
MLRNAAFSRGTKLHYLNLPKYRLSPNLSFASMLMHYTRGESTELQLLAVSATWAYLYNHQGVKAALNKVSVKNELRLMKNDCELHNPNQQLLTALSNILYILG